jgi:hypothetical protein
MRMRSSTTSSLEAIDGARPEDRLKERKGLRALCPMRLGGSTGNAKGPSTVPARPAPCHVTRGSSRDLASLALRKVKRRVDQRTRMRRRSRLMHDLTARLRSLRYCYDPIQGNVLWLLSPIVRPSAEIGNVSCPDAEMAVLANHNPSHFEFTVTLRCSLQVQCRRRGLCHCWRRP